jgi:hypothetical protein
MISSNRTPFSRSERHRLDVGGAEAGTVADAERIAKGGGVTLTIEGVTVRAIVPRVNARHRQLQ